MDKIGKENKEESADKFKRVGQCEFTSERGISSFIYERINKRGEKMYTIYSKGSDISIQNSLRFGQDDVLAFTNKCQKEFSEQGLRCLYVAKNTFDEDIFDLWQKKVGEADGNKKMLAKAHRIVEKDLKLIG